MRKVICSPSDIYGKVEFGDDCFIHPTVVINAEGGEIIFGKCNILEERVMIHNKPLYDSSGKQVQRTMLIGDYNLFEIGTVISNTNIGDCNHFEQKVDVDQLSEIGSFCRFGPKSKITSKSKIPDYSRIHFPFVINTNPHMEPEGHRSFLMALSLTLRTIDEANQNKSKKT